MFKLKIINKPKMIKMKCDIEFPDVVLANLQDKETTPTKETQVVVADKNYDGLSKVTVNPIPNEYIIPSGEIEFTKNGTYDVTDKASAKVNVPEKQLGTKIITKNGTYKASDDDLDGYSEVEVETSGVDINDYYVTSGSYGSIRAYIKKIPLIDTSTVTYMSSMFSGCNNLISIPQLNTSNVTNMFGMFNGCKSLTTIPQLDTSNVTDMVWMFYDCNSLTTIPLMDTSKVTGMDSMFYNCENLISIPQLNTSAVTSTNSMFYNCSYLTTIPQLDTSNVTSMDYIFYGCNNLISIPQLNLSKVTNVKLMFSSCSALTTLGGFQNLGMAYDTSKSANYGSYTLKLSDSSELTHDSLMNVINNLYDIKSKGCNPQSLVLGSTNISKLSAEELQICTERGWSVS